MRIQHKLNNKMCLISMWDTFLRIRVDFSIVRNSLTISRNLKLLNDHRHWLVFFNSIFCGMIDHIFLRITLCILAFCRNDKAFINIRGICLFRMYLQVILTRLLNRMVFHRKTHQNILTCLNYSFNPPIPSRVILQLT